MSNRVLWKPTLSASEYDRLIQMIERKGKITSRSIMNIRRIRDFSSFLEENGNECLATHYTVIIDTATGISILGMQRGMQQRIHRQHSLENGWT